MSVTPWLCRNVSATKSLPSASNVNATGVSEHRLGREQIHIESFLDHEASDRLFGLCATLLVRLRVLVRRRGLDLWGGRAAQSVRNGVGKIIVPAG